MDDTFTKIADLLSRRRDELRRHFEEAPEWEHTTAELLDRVRRLQSRLSGGDKDETSKA